MADRLKANYEVYSDKSKNAVTDSQYVKHGTGWLNDAVNSATTELSKKANKADVDAELAKKANVSDVTALQTKTEAIETTVSGKADSSTVAGISERVTQNTTKTVDLQSQIDNLVIESGGDSNPEVVQARTDAAGVSHTTLKDRIDSEVTNLKSELNSQKETIAEYLNVEVLNNWNENRIIKTGVPIGSTVDTTMIGTSGYYCITASCVAGDKFTITANGGGNPRAWAFIDNNSKLISVSSDSYVAKNLELVAPINSSMLIVNSYGLGSVIKGERAIDNIKKDIAEINDNISNQKNEFESEISTLFPNDLLINYKKSFKNGNPYIAFVGDSWTAGQGATESGATVVPGLPSTATDGFHKIDPSSGKFVDKIARALNIQFSNLNFAPNLQRVDSTTWNTYSGNWTYDNSSNIPEESYDGRIYAYSTTKGDSAVKKSANSALSFRVLKLPNGGKCRLYAKPYGTDTGVVKKYVDWKSFSELGVTRNDSYDDIDYLDLYKSNADYTQMITFSFPYGNKWEVKFEIVDSNPNSNGNIVCLGCSYLAKQNFVNCGRGNHTTIDYLGYDVSEGAGASGDKDHTNHIAQTLALNPSLIVFEPMIINDFFHGVSLENSRNTIEEMISEIVRYKGVDIIALMPGPIITENHQFDYSENPEYDSKPPLAENLKGLGTYLDYYNAAMMVLQKYNIKVIDTYKAFIEEYNSENHINWTLGSQAGRIHVNQHGHDIIYNAFIKESGLFKLMGN